MTGRRQTIRKINGSRESRNVCLLLIFVVTLMIVLVAAILQSSLERILKQTHALKKNLCHLAGLSYLRVFTRKIFISHRLDSGKIKWNRSFMKKLRSNIGNPAHLKRPAHFHMNNPLVVVMKLERLLKRIYRDVEPAFVSNIC